jgi:hypothetical protein
VEDEYYVSVHSDCLKHHQQHCAGYKVLEQSSRSDTPITILASGLCGQNEEQKTKQQSQTQIELQ